ncbi:C10 family peptidase [Prevotella sp. P6B4]|uniref:C10 family peptidase n=1 Tax=Prevotella sp. P6B4 TaxID=1410614 RepID=UPI00048E6461|nr:C10 family peptidase [Prevotella sp. P6B4]
MKKSLLTAFLYLFSLVLTVAAPVDEQKARQLASDFLRSKVSATRGANINLTRVVTGVVDGDDAGIYVFNESNGFVVISADDELPAVLAFGLNEPYDAQTAPPAMKALLEAYHYAATASVKTRGVVSTHADITPLIQTKWNQDTPYNLYCPDNGAGGKCPTGCIATSMAQIMYYHQWPSTVNWSAMTKTYDDNIYVGGVGPDTLASCKAVARLMADIGEKVCMSYGASSSYAIDIDACEALRNAYSYSETLEIIDRECYTAQSWDNEIYSELSNSRPVIYNGQSATSGQGIGGHSFIIDGYKVDNGTGYYHVNWGWGGKSDDYFLISVLNPQQQYTGGYAGSSGYSFGQTALVGIKPGSVDREKSARLYVGGNYIVNDAGNYSRASASADFPTMQLEMSCYNATKPDARKYDLAIALYQGRNQIAILDEFKVNNGNPLDYGAGIKGIRRSFKFGKDLANGTYQIRLLSRETGKTTWSWALGAACRYVELTINGNNMTTKTYGRYEEAEVSSFTINSVDVSSNNVVGEPITITINLTDCNKTYNAPIFLYGNASLEQGADKFQFLTGGGTNLEPGETGTVILQYTPQRAGNFKFILSGNSEKLSVKSDTLYVFTATVTGVALDINFDVDGAVQNATGQNDVMGTTLKGTLHVKNLGSEAYNDKIGFFPCEVIGNTLADTDQNVTKNVNIAVADVEDIPFEFVNLKLNSTYVLLVLYKEDGTTKYLNWAEDGTIKYVYFFTMIEDTGLQSIQLEEPDAEVYDLRGVRLGKASELKSLPKGIYIINKKKVINK